MDNISLNLIKYQTFLFKTKEWTVSHHNLKTIIKSILWDMSFRKQTEVTLSQLWKILPPESHLIKALYPLRSRIFLKRLVWVS